MFEMVGSITFIYLPPLFLGTMTSVSVPVTFFKNAATSFQVSSPAWLLTIL